MAASGRHAFGPALEGFAAEVGASGPVCVRGGGTRWSLGGAVAPGTREVCAPEGIVAFEPAEMTVRVRAGTTVADLHAALGAAGQRTALPERPGGTVGGALMAGESSIARLGLGPTRDALLQARYACADGRLAVAGAGTVKNVSGFDLCRLMVGSLGTLGLLGEALLRTVPVGESERWVHLAGVDPRAVLSCATAASVLWDGSATSVLLSGYGVDVDADLERLARLAATSGAGPPEYVDGPPELPEHRWSCTPAEAAAFNDRNLSDHNRAADREGGGVAGRLGGSAGRDADADAEAEAERRRADGHAVAGRLDGSAGRECGGASGRAAGRFVAEVGVGVVHASQPQPPRSVAPGVVELNRRFKERFDPTGRLNPGRDPLAKP